MDVTIEQINTEVIRLGTEYPNAVYRGHYSYFEGHVDNGPPNVTGCIFGQALCNLGLKEELTDIIEAHKADRNDNSCIPTIGAVLRVLFGKTSAEGARLYESHMNCQSKQDHLREWGDCIKFLLPKENNSGNTEAGVSAASSAG